MKTNHCKIYQLAVVLFMFAFFISIAIAQQAAVKTGNTKNFAILARSTITNTGNTVVYGDIGLFTGTSFIGSADVVLEGQVYLTDTDDSLAKDALLEVYNDVAGRTLATIIDTELGEQTLLPGVYVSDSGTFEITGVDSTFAGCIYATESITINKDADVAGQILSMTKAVTLDNNMGSNQLCVTTDNVDDLPNTSDNLFNQILLAASLLIIGFSLLYLARETNKKD